jgi:hypothetical protein
MFLSPQLITECSLFSTIRTGGNGYITMEKKDKDERGQKREGKDQTVLKSTRKKRVAARTQTVF